MSRGDNADIAKGLVLMGADAAHAAEFKDGEEAADDFNAAAAFAEEFAPGDAFLFEEEGGDLFDFFVDGGTFGLDAVDGGFGDEAQDASDRFHEIVEADFEIILFLVGGFDFGFGASGELIGGLLVLIAKEFGEVAEFPVFEEFFRRVRDGDLPPRFLLPLPHRLRWGESSWI